MPLKAHGGKRASEKMRPSNRRRSSFLIIPVYKYFFQSHQNTELQQKMAHLEETIRQMAEQIRILQMDLESEKEKTKYSEEFTMQIEREVTL